MRRLLLLAIVVVACTTRSNTVEFRPLPNAVGPFSEAVRAGNLLFVSGMIGNDSTGQLPPGGIGPETRQTLNNVKAALERNGLTMNDVVKCTVFLADINEWGAMNQVYTTFFPNNKPARSALGNVRLVRNARVELECIAAVR
jgi:2-iminobutanoate/2-iminopropanoate deaminase